MCSRIKLHRTDTDEVGSRRASKSLSDLLDGALPPRPEKRVDLRLELGGQCCSVLRSLGQMWRLPPVLSQSLLQPRFAWRVKLCDWNPPASSPLGVCTDASSCFFSCWTRGTVPRSCSASFDGVCHPSRLNAVRRSPPDCVGCGGGMRVWSSGKQRRFTCARLPEAV